MKLYAARNLDAYALLTWALRQQGLFSCPSIARTPNGKPWFPDCPGQHFSLSHSGKLCFCALSDRPVGADIELIRPRNDSLPRYALTDREYARYETLGGNWPAFYTLWTRKEAWCKYTGEGLSGAWGADPREDGLYYRSYLGADWRAAVCGEEPPPAEIIWYREAL